MSWKPDVFIYHSPCDDGFGAAWVVHQRWGGSVEYVPCTYGAVVPEVTGRHVLIGDFSFKEPILRMLAEKAASVVVLDHHKTAQEDLHKYGVLDAERFNCDFVFAELDGAADTEEPLPLLTVFDMEKSGARMVWDFVYPGCPVPPLIAFIEDRDLWRFQIPATKAFSLYLRSHPYDFDVWTGINEALLSDSESVLEKARAIEGFYDQKVAEMVQQTRWIWINGYQVPAVNCSWAFASDVAHAVLNANPGAPFAACYYDRFDGSRTYSLRSEDSRIDVSAIAKRYGGGGHRNAAGFEVPLP